MTVKSGFFNSQNGDRKYSTEDMGAIFDGIIMDGIYQAYLDAMVVKASSGNTITIGKGRAWFNHTWTYIDALYPLTLPGTEVLLDRYDDIVLEVNTTDAVRANTIKCITGPPSSNPSRPQLTNTASVRQYPLAYIRRRAGATAVVQADITDVRGTAATPYVTGPLRTMTIDSIVAQWGSQWNSWFSTTTAKGDNDFDLWMANKDADFNAWYSNLKNQLSGDVAANLQKQVDDLEANFNTLAQESAIYYGIEDSLSSPILDSNGGALTGRVVYKVQ